MFPWLPIQMFPRLPSQPLADWSSSSANQSRDDDVVFRSIKPSLHFLWVHTSIMHNNKYLLKGFRSNCVKLNVLHLFKMQIPTLFLRVKRRGIFLY